MFFVTFSLQFSGSHHYIVCLDYRPYASCHFKSLTSKQTSEYTEQWGGLVRWLLEYFCTQRIVHIPKICITSCTLVNECSTKTGTTIIHDIFHFTDAAVDLVDKEESWVQLTEIWETEVCGYLWSHCHDRPVARVQAGPWHWSGGPCLDTGHCTLHWTLVGARYCFLSWQRWWTLNNAFIWLMMMGSCICNLLARAEIFP